MPGGDCSKKATLTVTTSVFACVSFACLCVAVSTDYWLHAVERMAPEQTNNPKIQLKKTSSGLWRKCVEFVVQEYANMTMTFINVTCNYISYFQTVDKDKNELGPTDAILLSLRKSTIFPLFSLLLLLVGEIVCLMSHCDRRKKVLTFVSGILFVIAGLFTLIGLILYIGAITEEAGNKSKSASSSPADPPRFQYSYGSSFILTILSFTAAELTGVLSVYLYISRHKHSYRKKVERLQAATTAAAATASAALHPQPNNIDAAFPQHQHHHSSSSRPNGRAVLLNNGSPAMVGMATTGVGVRGNAALDAASFYAFAPMSGARSAVDVRGSRETLESDGLMAREPSRYTLSLCGATVDNTRTPSHHLHQHHQHQHHHHRYTAAPTADSYRRTTPV